MQQLADGGWQTTVVMSGASGTNCPSQADKSSFALETVSPAATEIATGVTPATSATTYPCELTVTFGPLGQIPASATLLYLGGSAIALTVSRLVTSFDYIWLPVLFGGAALALLLLLCFVFVQVYDENGARKKSVAGRLMTPVRATGAWTLTDSWATNIATLVPVVATVLGVSSAASELFPGADIGKFVILIDVIGAIATAVPLVFAVLYAFCTAREPGLSEDASLWLTATLGCRVTATLQEAAGFAPAGRRRWPAGPAPAGLEAGESVILDSGSRVMVPGTSKLALARRATAASLLPGTVVTLRPGAWIEHTAGHPTPLIFPTKARLKEATTITLPKRTVVTPLAAGLVELSSVPGFRLRAGTQVTLPGQLTATVAGNGRADLLAGGAAKITAEARITLPGDAGGPGVVVALPDKTPVIRADSADAGTVSQPQGVRARLLSVERDPGNQAKPRLASIDYGEGAEIRVPSGATITVPWGAAAYSDKVGDDDTQPVRMDASTAIRIPPGSEIRVFGGYLTLPGSTDILLQGDCFLAIKNPAGTLSLAPGPAPAGEGTPGPGPASLSFPVWISVRSGARIGVTGVAQLNLPEEVTVSAPRRETFVCSTAPSRPPIRVPQGTNTLVGPLWAVIVAAVFTTFSVGAQLGVATVLTSYLLGPSWLGLVITWLIWGLIGLFTVWYGVTAIRALADPQPGSSMSSTAGTSFTL